MSRPEEFAVGKDNAAFTDDHRAMLDFEATAAGMPHGRKEDLIRQKFNMTSIRYHQVINSLIDHPAALEHNPQLINRLSRIRDKKRVNRSAKQKGITL
jgi:hypothetical protein